VKARRPGQRKKRVRTQAGAKDELPRRTCPLLAGASIAGFLRSVKLLLGIEQNIVAGGMQRLKAKIDIIGVRPFDSTITYRRKKFWT
jgi:hypothetical protein